VSSVAVSSPIFFFSAAKYGLDRLAATLPLKTGDGFDVAKYGQGVSQITTAIRTGIPAGFTSMRFVATVSRLYCTADAVEVRYIVYVAAFPSLNGQSADARQAEIERPSTTGASLGSAGRFLLAPDFGYDHTRRVYGGMLIQSQAPLRVFDMIEIHPTASSDSLTGDIALSGSHAVGARYLNQAQWNLAAVYSEVPAGAQRLKEGKLTAGFFGTTKQLTSSDLLFHYAASLGGGHQQGAIQDSPNSSYGDLKLLTGVEGVRGTSAFAAAYGLQLGSTLGARTLDFAKHIVDLRYSLFFSPLPRSKGALQDHDDRPGFIGKDHRPFSLESRLNAGVIEGFGRVPGTERFLAGNQPSAPFIDGAPWDIRGQPYIRSIPENQLGSSNPAFALGGTRFYSLNLTVANGVFGKALLPKDLGTKDFVGALNTGIETAKGELADAYFGRDSDVQAANDAVAKIKEEALALKEKLSTWSLDSATAARIAPLLKALKSASKGGVQSVILTTVAILSKKQGFEIPILMNTQVPALESNLVMLQNAVSASNPAVAQEIGDRKNCFE
jgi:hypothetical protein